MVWCSRPAHLPGASTGFVCDWSPVCAYLASPLALACLAAGSLIIAWLFATGRYRWGWLLVVTGGLGLALAEGLREGLALPSAGISPEIWKSAVWSLLIGAHKLWLPLASLALLAGLCLRWLVKR